LISPRVKRPEYLVSAGLLASTLLGLGSAVVLWIAERYDSLHWGSLAALDHPALLLVGDFLATLACLAAAISLTLLTIRWASSSALAQFGLLFLGVGIVGCALLTILDVGLVRAASQDVLEMIEYSRRWDLWNAMGMAAFFFGGSIALVCIGLGVARRNRALRYPASALAVSALMVVFLTPIGVAALGVTFLWLGYVVLQRGAIPGPLTTAPAR
jgi:hypothetical protein